MTITSASNNGFVNHLDNKKENSGPNQVSIKTAKKSVLGNDLFDLNKNNKSDLSEINIFEPGTNEKKENANPWKVKQIGVSYGLMDVRFSKTDIRVQQPEYNTDVTLHNVEGEQRTSYSYIYGKPRFSPDEPEFNAKVNAKFENNFGIELDVKHNKYTVQKKDQMVNFDGIMNGQNVNEVRPFDSYSNLYDITAGNHQISLMGSYSIPLPSPKNQELSFNTKIGPSAIISYSHNSFKNPDGVFEETDRGKGLVFAGYGGIIENSLKYNLGKKLGGVTVELSHSISYLNFTNVPLEKGTASQDLWASQFGISIGKTFNLKK